MSAPRKPAGTVTTGFSEAPDSARWDQQPIYRIVEVLRDGEGRMRREGSVWHNDLERLRRFGRAVAANTVSHQVMITDAAGDIIEVLPVASAEARQAAWTSWGGIALPPAPKPVRRRPASAPAPASTPAPALVRTPIAPHALPEAAPAATPPRDVPRLPVAAATSPALPAGNAAPAVDIPTPALVPRHEATLP